MTNPTIYRSTDGSAPTIGNNNGDLTTALDAILVNGYGAKSALGWTIEATATSKRLYRAPAGSRMYLGIDDSVNVYEARVRGFETQSNAGIDATGGTGLFPTAAQLANGVTWQKTTNGAGNKAWIAAGDDKRFFILINVDASNAWNLGFFGDIESFKSGDAYQSLLMGKGTSGTSSSNDLSGSFATTGSFGAAQDGNYMPRSYSQAGSAIKVGKTTDISRTTSTNSGNGTAGSNILTYPDPIAGSLQVARFFVVETTGVAALRGYVPGLWCVCHDLASMSGVANGDTFTGADALNAMTFELRRLTANSTAGAIAVETTSGVPWT